jgi:hypothetical protein
MKLEFDFISNQLSAGNLKGEIRIPAMKENGLKYQALMSYNPNSKEANYNFTVSPQDSLNFEAFSAKVDLYPTSQINIQKQNGKFIPRAILTGKISIDHTNTSTAKLDFQNLTFVTYAPYLISGSFGNTDPTQQTQNKTAGFNVSISNVGLVINPTQPKIKFDAEINFMNAGDFSFTGGTLVNVKANVGAEGGQQSWDFSGVSIGGILLEVQTQPFYLYGLINFYENDPIFGKGFNGKLLFKLDEVHE